MKPLTYQGYYINLDRSVRRAEVMQQQLEALGISDHYQRFAAVDGQALPRRKTRLRPGQIGAFASHLGVLEQVAAQDKVAHVIEDDAILSRALPDTVASLAARGLLKRFDIMLTEMLIPPNLEGIRTLKLRFDAAMAAASGGAPRVEIIDLERTIFAGAVSYVVTPENARRILPLFREEWNRGPNEPVDIFMRRETHRGRLKMACAFPFMTGVRPDSIADSATADGSERFSASVSLLLRYSFFVDADLDGEARTLLDAIKAEADRRGNDARRDFLGTLLGLITSADFELF